MAKINNSGGKYGGESYLFPDINEKYGPSSCRPSPVKTSCMTPKPVSGSEQGKSKINNSGSKYGGGSYLFPDINEKYELSSCRPSPVKASCGPLKPVSGCEQGKTNRTIIIKIGGSEIQAILNNDLTINTTQSQLNNLYPDLGIGAMVRSETNNVLFIKVGDNKWKIESLDLQL